MGNKEFCLKGTIDGSIKERNIYEKINEGENDEYPSIPEKIIDILGNSIAKINFKINRNSGTGFFMQINLNKKKFHFFVSCYHVISEKMLKENNSSFTIKYGKENKIEKEIKLNKRMIFFEEDLDATLIEIIKEDNIPEDKYLIPDLNYKNGYDFYIGKKVKKFIYLVIQKMKIMIIKNVILLEK